MAVRTGYRDKVFYLRNARFALDAVVLTAVSAMNSAVREWCLPVCGGAHRVSRRKNATPGEIRQAQKQKILRLFRSVLHGSGQSDRGSFCAAGCVSG